MQLRKEAWKKNQDFNGVWTRDLAIPVRRSNQLSYEATDVGSRSIVGSYVPVKEMNVNDVYEINHIWTADMKSNEGWSSQLWTQFMQLRKLNRHKKHFCRLIVVIFERIAASLPSMDSPALLQDISW